MKISALPLFAERVLTLLTAEHDRDAVLGDMEELYVEYSTVNGSTSARFWLCGEILHSAPTLAFTRGKHVVKMLKQRSFRNTVVRALTLANALLDAFADIAISQLSRVRMPIDWLIGLNLGFLIVFIIAGDIFTWWELVLLLVISLSIFTFALKARVNLRALYMGAGWLNIGIMTVTIMWKFLHLPQIFQRDIVFTISALLAGCTVFSHIGVKTQYFKALREDA